MSNSTRRNDVVNWIQNNGYKVLLGGTLLAGAYFSWKYFTSQHVPTTISEAPQDSPVTPNTPTTPKTKPLEKKSSDVKPRKISKTPKFLDPDMLNTPKVPIEIPEFHETSISPPRVKKSFHDFECTFYSLLYPSNLVGIQDDEKFTIRNQQGDFLSITSEMVLDGTLQEYYDSQTIPKNIRIETKRGTFLGLQGLLGYIYDEGELKTYQFYIMCYHRVFLFYSNIKMEKIDNEWVQKFVFKEPELKYNLVYQSTFGFQANLPSNYSYSPSDDCVLFMSRVIGNDVETFKIEKKSRDISNLTLEETFMNSPIYAGRIDFGTILRVACVEINDKTWYISSECKIDNKKNIVKQFLESLDLKPFEKEQIVYQDLEGKFEINVPPCLILKDEVDIMFHLDNGLRIEIRKNQSEKKDLESVKQGMLDEIQSMECTIVTTFGFKGLHFPTYCVEYKDQSIEEDLTYLMTQIVDTQGQIEAIGEFPTENKEICLKRFKEVISTVSPL